MGRICVIGAGPAGCVFSLRMAALGHQVTLVERQCFPRPRLGESLSPGVMPLLETLGLRERIEDEGSHRIPAPLIRWGLARDPDELVSNTPSLIVDRAAFDLKLLDAVRACGVRILQPALAIERVSHGAGWRLQVDVGGRVISLEVDMLADARGRSGAGKKVLVGPRTLALHAYWRGAQIPERPLIEAGDAAWYWGVPLPNGLYNTIVFTDPRWSRAPGPELLSARFTRLLNASSLVTDCSKMEIVGSVGAIDATPHLATNCISTNTIKIGDAALAVDPLSSSGVQKAVQGALAGAIVANTVLNRPSAGPAAQSFYRSMLKSSSAHHSQWAGEHYALAALSRPTQFWKERAGAESDAPPPPSLRLSNAVNTRLRPCRGLRIEETPCLGPEYVEMRPALHHPRLADPVAFVGGHEMAPLLSALPASGTAMQLAACWSNKMHTRSALTIVRWLVDNGLFETAEGSEYQ